MSFKNRFKVICFYTRNTPYQQEVKWLKASCKHFGIPVEVEGLPSLGSWEKNVSLKPKFILNKLRLSICPLLWVDADAIFLKKPDLSLFAQCDFSVRFMEIFSQDPRYGVNAATLYMAKTKEAEELVEKWALRCEALSSQEQMLPFVDQISLYEVLLENTSAKIFPLPIHYCKIYDLDSFFVDESAVVIEQRQASRIYKPLI